MFKRHKSYYTFEIRRQKEGDIYFTSPTSDGREMTSNRDCLSYAYNNDFEDELPSYFFVKTEHTWNKKTKSYDETYYNIDRGYVMLCLTKSIGLVEVEKDIFGLAVTLEVPYLSTNKGYFIKAEDKAKLDEIIKTEYKPYVLKGTDWPYWFDVNGELVNSPTSSWANYLFTQHNIVSKTALESYKGPDKYEEHKNDDRK